MPNGSNITQSISSTDNVIAGFVFCLESLIGLTLYILVVYALIKRKFHKVHPAYFIIISLAVSEIWLLIFFFFMGLVIAFQNDFVPSGALAVQTFALNIPWAVDLAHVILLAFQRFAAVFGAVKFPVLQTVFGEKFCKLAVAGAWLAGAGYFLISYAIAPKLVTSFINYPLWVLSPLYPECADQSSTYWLVFNFTCILFSVVISLPTVIRVIVRSRKIRNSGETTTPEMRTLAKEKILVYMTALHASVLLFNNIVINILSQKADISWVRLILMCFFVLNNFVTPVIYLFVNKNLRKSLKSVLFRSPLNASTSVGDAKSKTVESRN